MQARLDLPSQDASETGGAPPLARRKEDRLAALRLARSRNVGPSTWARLVRRFGSAGKALEALPDLAGRAGVSRAAAAAPVDVIARELERGAAAGARLLVLGDSDYPAALAEIADPPPVLWLRGEAARLAEGGVAVVGSRNASAVGLRMARLLGEGLSKRGHAVVSGLARGVDGAAHEGALTGEGGTVGVLAGCVSQVYPAEHQALADRIAAEGGALISEAPIGLAPQARHFPRRNRIVAGLARGVVLIEAAARSGSLITADFALEQGREVMAVPGSPLDPRSFGGNALIRQGAALVRDAEDVIEALEPPSRGQGFAEDGEADLFTRAAASAASAGPVLEDPDDAPEPVAGACTDEAARAQVQTLLGLDPVEEDELAQLSGLPLWALADALLELELAGRLDRRPGGMLALLPEAPPHR